MEEKMEWSNFFEKKPAKTPQNVNNMSLFLPTMIYHCYNRNFMENRKKIRI